MSILHNLENKSDNLQDIQNAEVMVPLELFFGNPGRHKPVAGGFCLDLSSIIRGVSRDFVLSA